MLKLSVATWNINSAEFAIDKAGWNRGQAISQVEEVVGSQNLDILALQEVPSGASAGQFVRELSSRIGLPHAVDWPLSPSHKVPGTGSGMAILSRHPITRSARVLLPNPNLISKHSNGDLWVSHDKGVLACGIIANAAAFTFASLHLLPFRVFGRSPTDPEFQYIWKKTASVLEAISDGPLILCGDFNIDSPENLMPGPFFELNLRDLVDAPTRLNGGRHDKIYVTNHWFESGAHKVILTPSDHHLCMATISLSKSN